LHRGHAEVLDAVDQGLTRTAAGGPVWAELQYLKIELLVSLGRTGEACGAATAYLDSGDVPRRAEVRQIISSLR